MLYLDTHLVVSSNPIKEDNYSNISIERETSEEILKCLIYNAAVQLAMREVTIDDKIVLEKRIQELLRKFNVHPL